MNGLTPAEVALFDQEAAQFRAEILAVADRTVQVDGTHCENPLCPGLDVTADLVATLEEDGVAALVGVAGAALRLLGELRRGKTETRP